MDQSTYSVDAEANGDEHAVCCARPLAVILHNGCEHVAFSPRTVGRDLVHGIRFVESEQKTRVTTVGRHVLPGPPGGTS